jgi:hypothetical protein
MNIEFDENPERMENLIKLAAKSKLVTSDFQYYLIARVDDHHFFILRISEVV